MTIADWMQAHPFLLFLLALILAPCGTKIVIKGKRSAGERRGEGAE